MLKQESFAFRRGRFNINISRTIRVLQEHYTYFKNLCNKDFDPFAEVYKIEHPNSLFWNNLLADHIAKGLLFGYGEKNAQCFAKMMQEGKKFETFNFSTSMEIEPFMASKRKFSIPKFRSFEDEKIIGIYQKEQKQIEKIYRNGNVLEITLKKLTEKSSNIEEPFQ